ncbi:MAG TPA: proton-conducting transporter membrane subunit, partial [Devosia sp.]|nr:proton-conducting transporter membrane subunit [Devosia sp.]
MLDHSTPLADWVVVLPVILSLAGAALLLVLRRFVRWQPWLCAAALLLVFACDAMLVQRVLASGPLSMTMGHWLPPFGISFTADAMGACFALAASFVALCVLLYMQGDAPDSAVRDGVYPLLLLLIAGVSGAFLTGDLFNLYVWFEVMLIASFGLVVLAGHPLQLDAAVKYAVPNIVGTTLFLAALGLLYGLVGTLNMADIIGAAARADPALLAAVGALFLLAFGIKAAVFPVNAWLPASYHAPPAALSALLAALLSEVGVYAVIRVFVMLLPTIHETLGPVIFICGVLTVVLGPLLAIAETNLRRAIGFLLIGGVGVALLGVPEGHMSGYFAAVSYVLAAIPTLAALYLCAGLVERLSGHSDVR